MYLFIYPSITGNSVSYLISVYKFPHGIGREVFVYMEVCSTKDGFCNTFTSFECYFPSLQVVVKPH